MPLEGPPIRYSTMPLKASGSFTTRFSKISIQYWNIFNRLLRCLQGLPNKYNTITDNSWTFSGWSGKSITASSWRFSSVCKEDYITISTASRYILKQFDYSLLFWLDSGCALARNYHAMEISKLEVLIVPWWVNVGEFYLLLAHKVAEWRQVWE